MRIIAGQYKSRLIKAPASCHPMGDRVRMALFNMLGDISDSVVLDAYAGSGSLGIEAVSRGAASVICLEIKPKNYQVLATNIERIGDERLKAHRANALSWIKNQPQAYDLVFLDPPYDNIRPDHLEKLANQVKAGGRLALSYPPHYKPEFGAPHWLVTNEGHYGGACLTIYERGKTPLQRTGF